MVRTDHLLQVKIIRFMQCHHTPSSILEHSAFLLFACIVLWTDVITGIPLAVVAKLRARHLFPTSSLSKNKWNSFCYYLHVWFAFHSYSNKQNCNNICQWNESLNQQRECVQRQHAGADARYLRWKMDSKFLFHNRVYNLQVFCQPG